MVAFQNPWCLLGLFSCRSIWWKLVLLSWRPSPKLGLSSSSTGRHHQFCIGCMVPQVMQLFLMTWPFPGRTDVWSAFAPHVLKISDKESTQPALCKPTQYNSTSDPPTLFLTTTTSSYQIHWYCGWVVWCHSNVHLKPVQMLWIELSSACQNFGNLWQWCWLRFESQNCQK